MSLQSVLEKLRQEGGYDSTGQFTVDLERAERGVPVFSHPHAYLLLLLQCAALSRAPRLDFYTRAHRLECYFPSPGLDPLALHQKKDLILLRARTQPLDFLTAAVRAAAEFGAETVYWGCCSPEVGWGSRLRHKEVIERRLSGSGSQETECFFAVEWKAEGRSWRAHPRFRELEWVQRMATFCPFPVSFNGKLWPRQMEKDPPAGSGKRFAWLCDRVYPLSTRDEGGLVLPHCLDWPARVYDLGDREWRLCKDSPARTYLHQWRGYYGEPRPDFPLFPKVALASVSSGQAQHLGQLKADELPLSQGDSLLWKGGGGVFYANASQFRHSDFPHPLRKNIERSSLRARALLRVPARPRQVESHLILVQHGVCLEPVPLRLLMSDLRIVLYDDLQKTDLSGLKVQRDARLDDIVEWLNGELLTLAVDLRRAMVGWREQGLSKDWVIGSLSAQNLDIKDYD